MEYNYNDIYKKLKKHSNVRSFLYKTFGFMSIAGFVLIFSDLIIEYKIGNFSMSFYATFVCAIGIIGFLVTALCTLFDKIKMDKLETYTAPLLSEVYCGYNQDIGIDDYEEYIKKHNILKPFSEPFINHITQNMCTIEDCVLVNDHSVTDVLISDDAYDNQSKNHLKTYFDGICYSVNTDDPNELILFSKKMRKNVQVKRDFHKIGGNKKFDAYSTNINLILSNKYEELMTSVSVKDDVIIHIHDNKADIYLYAPNFKLCFLNINYDCDTLDEAISKRKADMTNTMDKIKWIKTWM